MVLINGRPFHVVGTGCVVRRRGGRLVALKDGRTARLGATDADL